MTDAAAGSVPVAEEEEVMPWELDRARSRTTDPAPLPMPLAAAAAAGSAAPAAAGSSPASPALNVIEEEEARTPVWHDSLSPVAAAGAASPKTQPAGAGAASAGGFDAASIPMGASRPAAQSSSPPAPASNGLASPSSASGTGRTSTTMVGGGLNTPTHRGNTGAGALAAASKGGNIGGVSASPSALAVLPIAALNPALSPVPPSSATPATSASTPRSNGSLSVSGSGGSGGGGTAGGAILKKGILIKLGGNILNKWKSRFFVLREDADFMYWPTERDWAGGKMAPLGRMKLNVDLHCWSEGPKELEWKFVSTDKTVVVRGTLQDKREWYDVIDAHVTKLAMAAGEGQGDKGEGRAPSPSLSSASSVKSRSGGGGGNRSRTSSDAEREDEVGDLFTSARENAVEPAGSNPRAGLSRSSSNVGAVDWAPGSSPETPRSRSSGGAGAGGLDRSLSNASGSPTSGSGGSFSAGSNGGSSGASFALPSKFTESEMARIIAKRQGKSRKAQQLFGWDSSELVIKDFSCAIEKHIMLHGRMYISEHFISFYTPLFSALKVVIPIADVLSVCQVNQALIFPNAIKVFVKVHEQPAGAAAKAESSYFFGSFAPGNRMNAYELITSLINATFDPSAYRMFDPADIAAAAAAAGGAGGRTRQISVIAAAAAEAAEEDETNGAEDATTEDMDESAPAPDGGAVPSLDFGEHRPMHSGGADRAADVELKDMHEECFANLSARAFFKLFLSDGALYNAEAYHKSKGDTEYQASGWKDAKLVEGASAAGWQLVRDTMVRVPVVGSPMGPDSTRVLKVQKQKAEEGRITLETVAVTPDVPFGDCFCLIDQWDITDLGAGQGCRVKIRLGILFVKKNWKLSAIKSMLVSRALGDNQKGFKAFVEGMKSYLSSHPAECDAVRKAVDKVRGPTKRIASATVAAGAAVAAAGVLGGAAIAAGAKGAAPGPSADGSSAGTTAAPKAAPATGLAALVSKLPPPLRDSGLPPAALVGGLAAGGLVLLWLLWLLLAAVFGSSSSSSSAAAAAAASTAAVAAAVAAATSGAADLNGTLSASGGASPASLVVAAVSPAAASAGLSWPVVLLLSALVCAVGGLAHRLMALETELVAIRAQLRSLATANAATAAAATQAASTRK